MDGLALYGLVMSAVSAAIGVFFIARPRSVLKARRRNLVRTAWSAHPADAPPSAHGIWITRFLGAVFILLGLGMVGLTVFHWGV